MNTATRSIMPWAVCGAVAAGLLIIGVATASTWLPHVQQLLTQKPADSHAAESHDEHAGHDHASHSAGTSVQLSANGLKNVDFQPLTIELGDYTRRITVPAMVVERPGRTLVNISAPLTGVITKIYPVEGASVTPGSPLFEMRLTHEELVAAQSNLIRTAESLAVVNRELARLNGLEKGVVAGKRIL